MQQFISKMKAQQFEKTIANEQNIMKNQDSHREASLSINTETCTREQGTSSYTAPILSPQKQVNLELSAEETLGGPEREDEVQYLTTVTKKPPSKTGMHIHTHTNLILKLDMFQKQKGDRKQRARQSSTDQTRQQHRPGQPRG
jgi:hypothetical protein